MSWKFIFNTNNLSAGLTFSETKMFVRTTGYMFFNFNGLIFTTEGNETGIAVEDCF